jgi:molecular chaperone GrpE
MVPEDKLTAKDEGVKDLVNLYEGLKMTENILMSTLKKHGLERFDPAVESEKFNPNEHEATFMTAMPDKVDNTVFLTQQKGFKLNGRVLRAAKVGVVKNS